MKRVDVRPAFAARVWRDRAAWLCAGVDQMGAACDRVWPATHHDPGPAIVVPGITTAQATRALVQIARAGLTITETTTKETSCPTTTA